MSKYLTMVVAEIEKRVKCNMEKYPALVCPLSSINVNYSQYACAAGTVSKEPGTHDRQTRRKRRHTRSSPVIGCSSGHKP